MIRSFEEYTGRLTPPSGALNETVETIRTKISGGGGAIIAWDNTVPIGCAQYYFHEVYMYIGRISVLPKYRGKGIGKLIVHHLEEIGRNKGMPEVRLEVRLSLPENVAYYTKLNYMTIEEHAYPNRTDRWYVMSKAL